MDARVLPDKVVRMADWGTRGLERGLGAKVRGALPPALAEFVMFVLKQGWACLFGGLFVLAILVTKAIWQPDWALARYDALFLFAVITQIAMLVLRLETVAEAKVILLFHLTGTAMEIFKIHMGSWGYPEAGIFKIGGVPMFSGFMYAAVGSYIARVIRVFEMRFAPFPPFWLALLLAVAIYVNFFSHHFVPDIRIGLFIATVVIFWRTRVWFYVSATPLWMPMPVAAFLCALALWIAENVGTFTGTWAYPGQSVLEFVSIGKLGSWYLLLYVSFVTVTLVLRDALSDTAIQPARRDMTYEGERDEDHISAHDGSGERPR
jgi:uncharacterized membrane protein YoaT (DUF817 family)